MNMIPVYASDGRLLGHLNMDNCVQTDYNVIVENSPRSPQACPTFNHADPITETIEIFPVPIRTLRFQCETSKREVRCLVADKLPDWFWDAYSTVKFSSDHWERL